MVHSRLAERRRRDFTDLDQVEAMAPRFDELDWTKLVSTKALALFWAGSNLRHAPRCDPAIQTAVVDFLS